MITRAKAYLLRRMIEKASASLSDIDALDAVELFPNWKAEIEYMVNDRVRYEDTLYKCLTAHISQATWNPADSPSLWVRVDDPQEEWPEWIQPVGSTDAYAKGAKVSHNGKHWISDVDGNVWEPGAVGAEALWHEA